MSVRVIAMGSSALREHLEEGFPHLLKDRKEQGRRTDRGERESKEREGERKRVKGMGKRKKEIWGKREGKGKKKKREVRKRERQRKRVRASSPVQKQDTHKDPLRVFYFLQSHPTSKSLQEF